MNLLTNDNKIVKPFFDNKRIALVGSGPGCLDNEIGFIDSFDVVVRVNNYKLFPQTGSRTDVYYSYFGGAIKKTKEELIKDGVSLCIAKCPNTKFMDSVWHERHNKNIGVDFRYIYDKRKDWWFCPTFVPTKNEFYDDFLLLNEHIPTTGFSAILKILSFKPKELYLTGFDFFESGVHNVNEKWRKINNDDPICHRPDLEKKWVLSNIDKQPFAFDKKLIKELRK